MKKINVAFLWHMHQPIYIDPLTERFIMPWVRLHAMQDYLDIPSAMLKPKGSKFNINFVPSLLMQLEYYIEKRYSDDYLEVAQKRVGELSFEEREFIVKNFFNINTEKVVFKSSRYKELFLKKQSLLSQESISNSFTDNEILDLQIHFQLGWSGTKLKSDSFISSLVKKDRIFTEDEKLKMLEIQYLFLIEVRDYIKSLVNSGAEVSLTPFYHPIIPVMNDITNVKKAWESSTIPNNFSSMSNYSKMHITDGVEFANNFFEKKIKGMWPAEGSVSKDFVEMLTANSDIEWIATDEAILSKSFGHSASLNDMSTPYSYNGVNIFFRNHHLSDKIGFVYSNWDTNRAVDDFIGELSNMRNSISRENPIISVILDGENAWEYYENHGESFLTTLFERLVNCEWINLTTFSEYIEENQNSIPKLNNLMPGSWIDGNFNTWINEEVKNIYWSHLYKLNVLIENYKKSPKFDLEVQKKIDYNFMIAQGSDWMWWAGKGHSSANDLDFDKLFRNYVRIIYELLELSPPTELYSPVYSSSKTPAVYKKPLHFIKPNISGELDSYYGWVSSGEILAEQGAIHKTEIIIDKILFGFDEKNLFFQIISKNMSKFKERYELVVDFIDYKKILLNRDRNSDIKYFCKEVCETAIPFNLISNDLKVGDIIKFRFLLKESGNIIERIPNSDIVEIVYPNINFDIDNWSV